MPPLRASSKRLDGFRRVPSSVRVWRDGGGAARPVRTMVGGLVCGLTTWAINSQDIGKDGIPSNWVGRLELIFCGRSPIRELGKTPDHD